MTEISSARVIDIGNATGIGVVLVCALAAQRLCPSTVRSASWAGPKTGVDEVVLHRRGIEHGVCSAPRTTFPFCQIQTELAEAERPVPSDGAGKYLRARVVRCSVML
jgi:hypothetical protein